MPLLFLFLYFYLIQTISYCMKYAINSSSSAYFQAINIYIIENDILVNTNFTNMTSIQQFFEKIQTKDNITLELISNIVINQVLLIKVNFLIISMNDNDRKKLIFQNSGKISINGNISFSLISLEINSNGSTILFEFEEMIGIFILVDIIILLFPYLKYYFLELFVSEVYQ